MHGSARSQSNVSAFADIAAKLVLALAISGLQYNAAAAASLGTEARPGRNRDVASDAVEAFSVSGRDLHLTGRVYAKSRGIKGHLVVHSDTLRRDANT